MENVYHESTPWKYTFTIERIQAEKLYEAQLESPGPTQSLSQIKGSVQKSARIQLNRTKLSERPKSQLGSTFKGSKSDNETSKRVQDRLKILTQWASESQVG